MAILPQCETPEGREERKLFLEYRRSEYEWQVTPGQPPYVRSLPLRENFSEDKSWRMEEDLLGSIADVILALVTRVSNLKGKLSSFDRFYTLRPKPSVAKRWQLDEEFARQRLDGVDPVLIRRCTEIPAHFPVTDEIVAGLLGPGETLASAIADAKLYLLDFHEIGGIPAVFGRFLSCPMALFYVDARKVLMPIAIQLGQSPAEAPVIFTPKDSRWLWLTARTHVQSADGTYHEILAHLLRTHLVMEPIAVALNRQLSERHPLNALLRPHFRDTMAINRDARTTLIAPGGPIDVTMALGTYGNLQLAARSYAEWSFDRAGLKADLAARGVLDPAVLPGYHYRDDALKLWDAIETFADEILRVFYRTDEDIRADYELQAWTREVTSEDGGRVRGFPGGGTFLARKDLLQVVAQVIFTCSVEHSAANNGQYDLFGYIPNTPGNLYLPPPTDKTELLEATLVYALPDPRIVGEQLALVHLLSARPGSLLGTYPPGTFDDNPDAQEAIQRFQARLASIAHEIRERNATLTVPYTYLEPSRVARSIAI
jgi:arachidonate 15-lipoxygenase